MSESQKERLQCNECHGPRWHVLRASYAAAGEEEVDGETEHWVDNFEIFQCQGCESVLVRSSFHFTLFGQEPEESDLLCPNLSAAAAVDLEGIG